MPRFNLTYLPFCARVLIGSQFSTSTHSNQMKTTVGQHLVTNLREIALARHGKAVGQPGGPDEARELNELGFRQALALGVALEPYKLNLVLSSPLKRARRTMAIATCGSAVWDVQELTCSTAPTDPVQIMWAELGNKPLAEYFEHRLGRELKVWAEKALIGLLREIETLCPDYTGQHSVLVGGHALLQNALLFAIAKAVAKEDCWAAAGIETVEKMALEDILGEGEAFVVKFPCHEAGVTTCEHLRPTIPS